MSYVSLTDRMLRRAASATVNLASAKKSSFEGYVESGLLALQYLARADQAVVLVPKRLEQLREISGQSQDALLRGLDWTAVGLLWDGTALQGELGRYGACKRDGMRFYLSMLTLRTNSPVPVSLGEQQPTLTVHANIVLFDSVTGVLERFDPYDARVLDVSAKLDRALRRQFIRAGYPVSSYVRPGRGSLLPASLNFFQVAWDFLWHSYNVQRTQIEELPANKPQSWNTHGMCLPWTILYARSRMLMPDVDPVTLQRRFNSLAVASNATKPLTKLIQHYSTSLQEHYDNGLRDIRRRGRWGHGAAETMAAALLRQATTSLLEMPNVCWYHEKEAS